jgi:hypothetical protein
MRSDKIADLHELGFADPVKMVTSFPEIGGLAIDNVRRKIADLRELGFNDPVKEDGDVTPGDPGLLARAASPLRPDCHAP